MTTTPAALSTRFAQRLRLKLDQMGAPVNLVSRCEYLAKLVGIESGAAIRLLDGKKMPNWDDFSKICELTKVEPGYYLNSDMPTDLPADAEVVHGATGGDPIVWRAPEGMDPGSKNARELAWLSGKRLTPDIHETDVLVFDQRNVTKITPNSAFVISVNGKLHAKCASLHTARTIVLSSMGDTTQILPVESDGLLTLQTRENVGIEGIYPIVGMMRTAKFFRI